MSQPAAAAPVDGSPAAAPVRASLVLGALGIVFGDIGTSPLYTLQECVAGKHGIAPDPVVVYGVVSLVCWSVTLVVTVKYLGFLMRSDNQGEGGIMALLALVPARLASPRPGRLGAIAALVLVGAALLYGDGVITPAISVLSALEGMEVATASLKPLIVPLTVAILLLLFLAQRRGTGGLGKLFGPVMIVWFAGIGALGAWQIARHPTILAALSPLHAVRFFAAYGWRGFRILGGVVLAVTGGEALYADMGHFGRKPIQIAWLGLIYPALLLCYLGQGASLLANPAGAAQPFYAMVPARLLWPMVIVATAATVIAAQALISGVFSLTHQAIALGYFPRLKVTHTSGESEGQIYVPLMNWGLAAACIALVLVFRESSRLAAAFGLAVSGTMLITSVAYAIVTRHRLGWARWQTFAVLALFLSFDIPFVVANSLKFLDGGYLPFTIAVAFVAVMAIWRIGRGLLREYFDAHSEPVEEFLARLDTATVGRARRTGVLMTPEASGVPSVLQRLVERFEVIYERLLLVTVITEHAPHVAIERRVALSELGRGLHRVVLRFGFLDEHDVPRALAAPLAAIAPATPPSAVVYVVGREHFAATSRGKMRRVPESIFELLQRNARNPSEHFRIPPEQVVELGMRMDL